MLAAGVSFNNELEQPNRYRTGQKGSFGATTPEGAQHGLDLKGIGDCLQSCSGPG